MVGGSHRGSTQGQFLQASQRGSAHSLIRKNLALNQSLVGALRTHLDDPNESPSFLHRIVLKSWLYGSEARHKCHHSHIYLEMKSLEILWLIAGWRTGPQVSYWQEHVFPMSSHLFISQRALRTHGSSASIFLVFRGGLPGTAFPESFLLDLASWLGEVVKKDSSGWSESNVRCLIQPCTRVSKRTRDGKRERNGKGGATEAAHQRSCTN